MPLCFLLPWKIEKAFAHGMPVGSEFKFYRKLNFVCAAGKPYVPPVALELYTLIRQDHFWPCLIILLLSMFFLCFYHWYVGHGLGEQVCAGPSIPMISSSEYVITFGDSYTLFVAHSFFFEGCISPFSFHASLVSINPPWRCAHRPMHGWITVKINVFKLVVIGAAIFYWLVNKLI